VQYQREFAWDKFKYAPYPALISPPLPPAKEGAAQTPRPFPRITDENSPVKFLKPNDPLLNRPNKITQDDFNGWVQERGLYFWTQFDSKYTPLLAINDRASRAECGSSTRGTAKELTFTRGSLSSVNCPKVFPERTVSSSIFSAPRGQVKQTGHIAAASESPCYSLLPEESHAK